MLHENSDVSSYDWVHSNFNIHALKFINALENFLKNMFNKEVDLAYVATNKLQTT